MAVCRHLDAEHVTMIEMETDEKQILQGDMSAIEFPDVLSMVSMLRKPGRLVIRHENAERTIYWNQTEVVFATSNSPEHSLGNFLVRNGKISEEQYRESLSRLEPGMRHGKLLVQLGFISPKDLWWGVKNQVLEIIYSLFLWDAGQFSFIESVEDIQERITLSINTSSLIMEGVRRIDESPRIRERITNLDVVFARIPGAEPQLEALELSGAEIGVFELIDGSKSVRDLISQTNLPEFDITHILYQMLTARLIEEVLEPKEARPVFLDVEDSPELLRVVSTYNDMFERLFSTLKEAVAEIEAREVFAGSLDSSDSDDLWSGVFFDQYGRFDENMLIANISELPFERRKVVLDEGLNTLLSIMLFEVSQHLDQARKVEVFKFISDQKAELEAAAR